MNRKLKIKIFLIIIPIILLILLVLLGAKILLDINNSNTIIYSIDSRIDKINNILVNTNITGWLRVQGTNIDYPVVWETQELYESGKDYLWRPNSYNDNYNREVIYGHNILNVSNKPLIADATHKRFEQLMSFARYDFAKDNMYIQYTKNGKDTLYKIYAIGFDTVDLEKGSSFEDTSELTNYISKVRSNSIYNYNIDVNSKDKIISLITCTRYFGLYGKTQFRVDARLVRENEKIVKYKIETNQNYDIIK